MKALDALGATIKELEGHKSDVNSVIYSPDGKFIASGSTDMTVRIWNLTNGKEYLKF